MQVSNLLQGQDRKRAKFSYIVVRFKSHLVKVKFSWHQSRTWNNIIQILVFSEMLLAYFGLEWIIIKPLIPSTRLQIPVVCKMCSRTEIAKKSGNKEVVVGLAFANLDLTFYSEYSGTLSKSKCFLLLGDWLKRFTTLKRID